MSHILVVSFKANEEQTTIVRGHFAEFPLRRVDYSC